MWLKSERDTKKKPAIEGQRRFEFETTMREFGDVFHDLYEIDVDKQEHFILIAVVSLVTSTNSNCENCFLHKLRMIISRAYFNSIKKIWGLTLCFTEEKIQKNKGFPLDSLFHSFLKNQLKI